MQAVLMLEDGTVFYGTASGAPGEVHGEVVFNTSMTGYQEILTDASYCGEIVAMTYPLIGNCGMHTEVNERFRPYVRGLIMGEVCTEPSNWRSTTSLTEYLRAYGVVAISGIDTRALTKRLRTHGTMKGALACADVVDISALLSRIKEAPSTSTQDLVGQVTTPEVYTYNDGNGPHVVVVDLGVSQGILSYLQQRGFRVTVVPANSTPAHIVNLRPAGVLLSNGPGNPKMAAAVVETTRQLLGSVPLFGIGLGHLILGLAVGADTYKLPYGHRGANHPVQDVETKKVKITAQNHGYGVVAGSLPTDVAVTHVNLNDGTIVGMRHLRLPAASMQYYPETLSDLSANRHPLDEFLAQLKAV